MGQTVAEKIAQRCAIDNKKAELSAGDFVSLRPRHVLTHDNSAAVMPKFASIGASKVADASQPVFALDHDIQNTSPKNLDKYASIEAFARKHGITFYAAGSGIGHQMMVEGGHVVPGSLVVASDSHANMYGALGALGTPVVRTDAAAIWATGEFWWVIPPTVQVVLEGSLREGVGGKDVILTLCGLYTDGQVLNNVIEFCGDGVASLSMDERLTIANMTTEWGALAGWFPVDETTLTYLETRREKLFSEGIERITRDDLEAWRETPPAPDADAAYAARIMLDLSSVVPFVAGPDSVQKATSLEELAREKIAVDKAYLLSCVNSRYEDLAAAARVLQGQKVAERVTLYVAAASREVEARARKDGIWTVFEQAGARFLAPGCGPCIGLGEGLLNAGEVGISATNRNFKGRMGSRDARCFLASPQVVAAAAVAGEITEHTRLKNGVGDVKTVYQKLELPAASSGEVEIEEGFVSKLSGRLVYLPIDNLNTDGIYGKDYTYREDMAREQMARVVMENYDPMFSKNVSAGDIVIGGNNFGTGSSREQAVTAFQAKGIPLVIAGSFSQTYLRNAFNNGFLCLQSADFLAFVAAHFAAEAASGQKTIICEQQIEVDFRASTVSWQPSATSDPQTFAFPALSRVAQALVVAGGVENLARRKLGVAQ
jgi:homoaconitate hydratase